MRFLASCWERLPVRTVFAVLAIVGMIGVQVNLSQAGGSIGASVNIIVKPSGEVWA